jgi:hypothetical protein
MINQIRRVWAELDYADRRVFEIRTGISTGAGDRKKVGRPPKVSRTVEELELLYAASDSGAGGRLTA